MDFRNFTRVSFFIISVILLLPAASNAQMITGVWKGKINRQKVEVKIIKTGDSLTGTSYYYESANNYRRYSIKGYFDPNTNSAVWWDDQLIEEKSGRFSISIPGKIPMLSRADFNCPGGSKMMLDGNVTKKENDTNPFGTQLDVYQEGYEWINHSIRAIPFGQVDENPKIKIGSSQCEKPYEASLFNISAMSFGSLSKNAILALNKGAKLGGFYHNTGEGGLSQYHLTGGDVVWNIGTGYFSCRTDDGKFSYEEYTKK